MTNFTPDTFISGPFEFEIGGPYPVWVNIKYDDKRILIRHDELRFLQFVIERAIEQSNYKLKGYGGEKV